MAVSRFTRTPGIVQSLALAGLLSAGISSGALAYDEKFCATILQDEDYKELAHVPRRELGFFEKSQRAVFLLCQEEAAERLWQSHLEEADRVKTAEDAARAAGAAQRARGIGPREIPLCVGNCR